MLFGVYCGNPNGNDAQAMATFHANLDAFEAATGKAAQCMNAFADARIHYNEVVANMGWTAWSWRQSPRARHLIPVVGLPMSLPGWEAPASYQGTAEGALDGVWRGLAEQWRANGFDTVYWRPGWEHNASHFAWGTHQLDNAGLQRWIAAWRRIAQAIRSVDGMRHRIVWCPHFTASEPRPWQDTYPGDDVVDVIGLDFYAGQITPVSFIEGKGYFDWQSKTYVPWERWLTVSFNRWHFWLWPGANEWVQTFHNNALGIAELREFHRAHGKPLALGECGSGIDPRAPHRCLTDDRVWVDFVVQELLLQPGRLEFCCLWDIDKPDGHWKFSSGAQPRVAHEWQKALAQLPAPPPPPLLTLDERVAALEGRLKAAGIP